MFTAWRLRSRDPRQARFLTAESLRWVLRHRAYTPWYLLRYWRFLRFKLANPHVITTGLVFLGRDVELVARPGFGRLVLGRWVHLGDGTSVRCHEGTVHIGDKVVFGRNSVINGYLDITIGATSIIADLVYISDFDHVFADDQMPIKDQGIVKSPVRIGADVWLGTKVTVVRGTAIGDGCVVAANAVVTRDLAPHSIAVGVPARAIRSRRQDAAAHAQVRQVLTEMAAKLPGASDPAHRPDLDPGGAGGVQPGRCRSSEPGTSGGDSRDTISTGTDEDAALGEEPADD